VATDAILIGLGCFTLTWFFSFWYKTEWLRNKLGIWYMADNAGEIVEREDVGGTSFGCPGCCGNWPACSPVVRGCTNKG